MKKITKIIIFTFFSVLLLNINNAYAALQTGYVDTPYGLIVRSNAGTSYTRITTLSYRSSMTIDSVKNTSDGSNGCPSGKWFHMTSSGVTGYVCTQYVSVVDSSNQTNVSSSEMSKMSDVDFQKYLQNQGFPSSYITKLKALHKSHPNWVFKGVQSRFSWADALREQNTKGRSLFQVNSYGVSAGLQGYLATGSDYYNYATDKFVAYDASTWFQANSQTISYYMDPRNFLTEAGIFMFEDLTYYQSYQTESVVRKILYSDFFKNYIQYFMEGARTYNVSPVYLAALSRNEVGLNSSTATSGQAGTYNGVNYNGYYNFFNIGAYSGASPVYNGLAYSKNAGWTTPQKAIVGGAGWIVNGYISKGQYTRYFQKWNVSPTAAYGIYHQYMTAVNGVVSPAATTAASYSSMGVANEPIVFTIPIYSGMPDSTPLPPTGNPNNWLKDLKVNSTTVKNFSGATTSYNLGEVDYNSSSINISATTVNSNARIDGDGKINLAVGKNTLNVVVTAQNGSKRTYVITITRKQQATNNSQQENTPQTQPVTNTQQEISISNILNNLSVKYNNTNIYGFNLGTTANALIQNILKQNPKSTVKVTDSSSRNKTTALATGDKVTITSNNETKTYSVIIFGDLNGDSTINAKDLLVIRKYLLKENSLSGVYLESAKLNKATVVNAKDLLILRKYLLGTQGISQK